MTEQTTNPYSAPKHLAAGSRVERRSPRSIALDMFKGTAGMTLLGVPAFAVLAYLGQTTEATLLHSPLPADIAGDASRDTFILMTLMILLFVPCAAVVGAIAGGIRPFLKRHRWSCAAIAGSALGVLPLGYWATRSTPTLHGAGEILSAIALPLAITTATFLALFTRPQGIRKSADPDKFQAE